MAKNKWKLIRRAEAAGENVAVWRWMPDGPFLCYPYYPEFQYVTPCYYVGSIDLMVTQFRDALSLYEGCQGSFVYRRIFRLHPDPDRVLARTAKEAIEKYIVWVTAIEMGLV